MLSVCVNICSGDELLFLAPLRLYLCHKTPLQNHPTAMHQPPQFPATFKTHPERLFKCIEMKEKASLSVCSSVKRMMLFRLSLYKEKKKKKLSLENE